MRNRSRFAFLSFLFCFCGAQALFLRQAEAAECVALSNQFPESCLALHSVNASIHSPFPVETISSYLQLFVVAPKHCQNAAAEFICQFMLPPCTALEGEEEEELLNQRVCRSVCEEFFVQCEAFFEETGEYPEVTCALFTDEPSTQTLKNGSTVAVPCASLEYSEEKGLYPIMPCPPELVEYEGLCILPCPNPLYSEEEMDTFDALSTTCWTVSLVSSTFFLLTQIGRSISKKINPLHNLTFWMLLSTFLACLNGLWGMCYGWADLRCHDDRTRREDGACAAWGFFFAYFSLSMVMWWLIVVLNMLLCVVLQRPTMARWVRILYHVCGWFLPVIPITVLAAADKIGYDGSPWCQPRTDDADDLSSPYWWTFSLFYLPIIIMVVIGLTANIAVVALVWKWGRMEGLKAQWRTVVLVFGMSLTFVFILGLFFQRVGLRDEAKDEIVEYVKCLLARGGAAEDEECEATSPYNYPFSILALISTAGYGGTAVLIFGTRLGDFMFWQRGLKNVLTGENFFAQQQKRRTTTRNKNTADGGDDDDEEEMGNSGLQSDDDESNG
ncbi:hypothetical protein QOT17_018551 [Balamuthia mandrillaris]